MELNAEQIKNEIQSLIKALKDCGGWVKRGNGEGWFNHEILADALALITSQEQRIKELNDKNEGLKAENELLLNCMHISDNHGDETIRVKLNLPDPLNSGEEYVINHQKTIKQLIQKNKELTESNAKLVDELEEARAEILRVYDDRANLIEQQLDLERRSAQVYGELASTLEKMAFHKGDIRREVIFEVKCEFIKFLDSICGEMRAKIECQDTQIE